jgi:hypothetical protein
MTLEAMGQMPEDIPARARLALRRLTRGDSEIRELFLDSGSYQSWLEMVSAVDAALEASA